MAEASRQMVNLLATQCLKQWKQKAVCHEVSIVDGKETFREITKSATTGEPMGLLSTAEAGHLGRLRVVWIW